MTWRSGSGSFSRHDRSPASERLPSERTLRVSSSSRLPIGVTDVGVTITVRGTPDLCFLLMLFARRRLAAEPPSTPPCDALFLFGLLFGVEETPPSPSPSSSRSSSSPPNNESPSSSSLLQLSSLSSPRLSSFALKIYNIQVQPPSQSCDRLSFPSSLPSTFALLPDLLLRNLLPLSLLEHGDGGSAKGVE